ncbi:MFS transporter [Fervidobacterium thailandense]|uniref:Major facilitator superfamily (MFS) profile domain-containing protein n=1 Tax=Fervidobacterium thailandense TaxID=1008305 RepID=A0A1E3G675_9BACT|nr:MFS transporter [Fervidobacterium thailandense]ODN31118.1 hypothetical protein A4H02_02295 [Fervidobacterium thailandense]
MSWKSKVIFVSLSFASFVILGGVYSWSVLKGHAEATLDLTAFQGNLPFMLFLLFYSLFMPVGGYLQRYLGINSVFLLGTLMVVSGYLIASFSGNFVGLLVGYGVLTGSGVGLCYNVPLTIVARSFERGRGAISGLILAGFGISPLISAPLFRFLINTFGFFAVFRIYGFISLLILGSTYLAYFSLFRGLRNATESARIDDSTGKANSPLSEKFFILYVLFFLSTTIGLMFIGITSQIGGEIVGLSLGTTTSLITIFALFNAFGRVVAGVLLDKMGGRAVLSLFYTLHAIALLLGIFLNRGQTLIFIFSMAVIWMNFGAWLAIAPFLTRKLFGEKRFGENYGLMFTAYGLGAIFGNFISGFLKDSLGSYKLVFVPALVLTLMGFVLSTRFFRTTEVSRPMAETYSSLD